MMKLCNRWTHFCVLHCFAFVAVLTLVERPLFANAKHMQLSQSQHHEFVDRHPYSSCVWTEDVNLYDDDDELDHKRNRAPRFAVPVSAAIPIYIAASASLLGCLSIIAMFVRFKALRRHPHSLVMWRSIADLGFCLTSALSLLYHTYVSSDCKNDCQFFSPFTQAFATAAELYLLFLSIDLVIAVRNPFTNYKRNRILYHMFVFIIATGAALYVAFGRLPHDVPIYGRDNYLDICWLKWFAPKKDNDGFERTQAWYGLFGALVLFSYIIMIIALIYSRIRLRKGLRATLLARRDSQKNSILYLQAYTVYWTCIIVILIILDCTNSGSSPPAFLQGLLGVLLYSRGIVTFTVWMFTPEMQSLLNAMSKQDRILRINQAMQVRSDRIASITKPMKSLQEPLTQANNLLEASARSQNDAPNSSNALHSSGLSNEEQHDTAVPERSILSWIRVITSGFSGAYSAKLQEERLDLRPQLNLALRNEVLYYTTLGIRAAVGKSLLIRRRRRVRKDGVYLDILHLPRRKDYKGLLDAESVCIPNFIRKLCCCCCCCGRTHSNSRALLETNLNLDSSHMYSQRSILDDDQWSISEDVHYQRQASSTFELENHTGFPKLSDNELNVRSISNQKFPESYKHNTKTVSKSSDIHKNRFKSNQEQYSLSGSYYPDDGCDSPDDDPSVPIHKLFPHQSIQNTAKHHDSYNMVDINSDISRSRRARAAEALLDDSSNTKFRDRVVSSKGTVNSSELKDSDQYLSHTAEYKSKSKRHGQQYSKFDTKQQIHSDTHADDFFVGTPEEYRSTISLWKHLADTLFCRVRSEKGVRIREVEDHYVFCDYESELFSSIRKASGVSDEQYMDALRQTKREKFSEGASGAFLYFSDDERFIVKTMTTSECEVLLNLLPAYGQYLEQNPNSLLTRFFGCHSIYMHDATMYFVVMANVLATEDVPVHERYDLKGSWVKRHRKPLERGQRTECRYCNQKFRVGAPRRKNMCPARPNRTHVANTVLKDNDLVHKLRLGEQHAQSLGDQLSRDIDFLRDRGIMDYSLLLGIHRTKYQLVKPPQLDEMNHYDQINYSNNQQGRSQANRYGLLDTRLESVHELSPLEGGAVTPIDEIACDSSVAGYPIADRGVSVSRTGFTTNRNMTRTQNTTNNTDTVYVPTNTTNYPSYHKHTNGPLSHEHNNKASSRLSGSKVRHGRNSVAHALQEELCARRGFCESVGDEDGNYSMTSLVKNPSASPIPSTMVTAVPYSNTSQSNTTSDPPTLAVRRLNHIQAPSRSNSYKSSAESTKQFSENPRMSESRTSEPRMSESHTSESRTSEFGSPTGIVAQRQLVRAQRGGRVSTRFHTASNNRNGSSLSSSMPSYGGLEHLTGAFDTSTVQPPLSSGTFCRPPMRSLIANKGTSSLANKSITGSPIKHLHRDWSGVSLVSLATDDGHLYVEQESHANSYQLPVSPERNEASGSITHSPHTIGGYDRSLQNLHTSPQGISTGNVHSMQHHPTSLWDSQGLRAVVVEGPGRYYLGLIDILQRYTWRKKIERWIKTRLLCRSYHGVSSIPPEAYAARFRVRVIGALIDQYQLHGVRLDDKQYAPYIRD